MKRTAIYLLTALTLLATASACSRKSNDDGTAPISEHALAPLTVKDDSADLLLTWIDDKGEAHIELRPADVPAAGRALVRVVVADREDGTHDLFYVADLTRKQDDGSYATRTIRRREWESEIEKRRDAYLARTAPPGAASGAPGQPGNGPQAQGQASGAPTVIIYGASWCGPCHQAADFLKAKGVAYVLKDIEQVPGAAAEMREKLARAGQHGGSIPVIDVRGQILVGYSEPALARALARAPAGTML